MKPFDPKFKPRSPFQTVLGAGLLVAIASPALATSPSAPGVNPSALMRTDGDLIQVAAMKNPCNPCAAHNPCNPCAAHNPCNPCAAKNPCAARNPCAASNPCNPCNPCGGNPCAGAMVDAKLVTRPKGTKLASGNHAALVREGKALFMSEKLSTNGMSCVACHSGGNAFEATFSMAYPHKVAMAVNRGGINSIALDEMIQFCMVVPMAATPLPWGSRELAALTAYTAEVQKTFVPEAAGNPCNPCNPCAPHNPCAARNPCAAHNPCAAKNPCAAH